MHLAGLLKRAGGIPAHGNRRSAWDAGRSRSSPTPNTADRNPEHR